MNEEDPRRVPKEAYSEDLIDRMWLDVAPRRFTAYLGELALAQKLIDSAQLESALAEQASSRAAGPAPLLGEILVRRGWVTTTQVAQLLEEQRHLAPAPFDALVNIKVPSEVREAETIPGRKVAHYVMVTKIGHGGMGTVWKAWDRRLDRWVAIKILRIEAEGSARQRFLREARLAARLSHPHLVTVFESGESEGTPYLVMELVQGSPIALKPPLRPVVETLRKVALAIEEVHRQGIVHRDLKPGNILIDNRGEPRVVDFGLAQFVDSESRLTRTGSSMGTPQYMAPEQVAGRSDDIGPRTDVYALGALLYEAMTGSPPFMADSAALLFEKILHAELTEPVGPRDLIVICTKALEKKPASRYASALEFADELQRYLEGQPIHAHPPGSFERLLRRLKKRGRAIAVVASILAVGIVGWRMYTDAAARKVAADQSAREADLLKRDVEVKERLMPMIAHIVATRGLFYRAEADIPSKLLELEGELDRLEKMAGNPRYASIADLWATIGIGRWVIGDAERAERALRTADKLDPSHGLVSFYLSKIYLERMLEERITDNVAGSDIERRVEEWNRKAGRFFDRPTEGWANPAELERHVVRAIQPLGEGNPDLAMQLCDEGIKRFDQTPGAEEFWNIKGCILGMRGKLEAVGCFDAAICIRPHYAWGLLIRGCLHRGLSRRDASRLTAAMSDLDAAIRINPRLAVAFTNRGGALRRMGKTEEAMRDFNESYRLKPGQPLLLNDRGALRMELKDVAGALTDFEEAIRLRPDFPESYVHRGIARLEMGDPAAAIADFDEAIKRAPVDWERRQFTEKLIEKAKSKAARQ